MKTTKALFGILTITMALAVPHQAHTFMNKLITMLAAITLMVVAVANTASAQNSWSFVMLGDTRDDNNTSTGISPYLNTIAQKIASLNPQLVIMDGDLCNGDALNTKSPWYPADGNFTNAAMKATYAGFFANWKTAMQPIFNYSTGTGIPIYTVRGNHENEDVETATIEVLKQAYQEAFSAYVPTNGPNNGLTDDERGFSWAFTSNNVTFVAADQYFNFDPTYVGGTTPWSGYHSLDQAWVTRQLGQSTSPYKIFIAHEPIFQTEGNGPNEEETVADYVTQIVSAKARPIISLPFDPRAGTFSYARQDPASTGLSYSIETSPDLSAWSTDVPATQTVIATANNTQTVQVTLSGTKPLTAPKLFIRVVAQ
jgi:hypothetical protein